MAEENENSAEGSTPRTTRAAKKAQEQPHLALEAKFDKKFARLESAMHDMAASVAALAKKKAKKRKNKEAEDTVAPPPKKAKKAKKKAHGTDSTSTVSQQEGQGHQIPDIQHHELAPLLETATAIRPPAHAPAMRPTTSSQPSDLTSRNEVSARQDVAEVNKQGDWAAWLLNSAEMIPPPPPKPTSIAELPASTSLQAQVNSIIENTPSLLSKPTSKVKNFPYEYVKRGKDKRLTAMNTLSLAEHIWGIFAMIHDHATQDKYKPALLRHIEEVVEDCRDYDWASAVRPWSEEIFSLVMENRLPNGWLDVGHIQLLRMSISRTSTAKLSNQRDFKPRQPQAASDHWKGGLPCLPYNSAEGCSLPSGHNIAGRRMQHVCAHCFHATGATYPHPEVNCRNRNRQTSSHFQ